MKSDIRQTCLYAEAEAIFQNIRRPGTGQISDAFEIHPSRDGTFAVFAGAILDKLEGLPPTRICRVDLESEDVRVLTFGPNTDKTPRISPGADQVAFLSDRLKSGVFQLYLLDLETGAAHAAPRVDGTVEYLAWSPDANKIMFGVAGLGADMAGAQGATTMALAETSAPPWMPKVFPGDEALTWRRLWVYELASGQVRCVSRPGSNIWEAAWCGNDALTVVYSPGPQEGLWYTAKLGIIDSESGKCSFEYTPHDQIGLPAASPSGCHLALVSALCSDRWIVAGQPLVFDVRSRAVREIPTLGVDVTYTEWHSDTLLLLAGHRKLESVVLVYDLSSNEVREAWSSAEISTGGRYFTVAGFGDAGDCLLIGEGFLRAPEIAMIKDGVYQVVRSLDLGYGAEVQKIKPGVRELEWTTSDHLKVQGWLLTPQTEPPYPLLVDLHGGPVWLWRPRWMCRGTAYALMLLKRGYAVFLPNPRGSVGQGLEFIKRVLGDLGGADARDCLDGIDYLIETGIADPAKIGVTGASYGGYLTSWLITQETRFAAAVPVSPITNFVTERLVSNAPEFVSLFLGEVYADGTGKYFSRSPVMHAHKVTTPTLNVCGALDRCTPPEEAMQFHTALCERGIESGLLVYPEEGHGVRSLPAVIDFSARAVEWFERHLKTTT